MILAFQVHPADNVATLLADASSEPLTIIGANPCTTATINLIEPTPMGHKIALRNIAAGEAVMKFGIAIGLATREILQGEWVHLQNCRGREDMRSATFDVKAEAAADMTHE